METSMDHSRAVLAFGPFRWLPEQRALFKGEESLSLGSRTRGILSILLERAGQLVKRNELIARVWGGIIVEEGTFRVHISALRKALEHEHMTGGYIETVNGLGYRFVGQVEYLAAPADPVVPIEETSGAASKTRMIGRDGIVATVQQRLQEKRFLTVVGPGGIGKTTVASVAMERLRADYTNGAFFVDLASITDERLVASVLADTFDIACDTPDCSNQLIERLADRQMLIVLDNCEHVIDALAPLAETLLSRTTQVHVLATSREPLRVEGESILRLPPLEVPPPLQSQSTQDVLRYSAVQLFVKHAMANDHEFELTNVDAPLTAEICRRLDGVPLAIELAAAQVGLLGIRGLAAHLDDLLDLLTQGRRTAPLRHRTLRATLQWSFNLLSDEERMALRRLSTAPDSFDLRAASAIVARDGIGDADAPDIVSRLIAKSLLVVDSCQAGLFRMFHMTRSFVLSESH